MADRIASEASAAKVAETVRRALLLVGPAESGVERVAGDRPVEESAG